jgi:hypothetical protein
MPKFLCVGGLHDGQWMTVKQAKATKEYARMPIRACGKGFMVFRAKYLSDLETVMILLDGYRAASTARKD